MKETPATGIIYRNPAPHVISRHAYFPWIAPLDDGRLLASFVLGEAFESVNLDTYCASSGDGGQTWGAPLPVLPATLKNKSSNVARITSLGNGVVVAMAVRQLRGDYPGEGLANPQTMGFVPTEVWLFRSADNGATWNNGTKIETPLEGPAFEACSAIVRLRDGRWIWPTSTWKGWDGYNPTGMRMVAFVSHDEGKTWPAYMDVMDGRAAQTIFWEGKVKELQDGTLLAVSWAFDEKKGEDRENHYAWSNDGGQSWSPPASTGIKGQTMALTQLPDGRLLTVYRRSDEPGLWASTATLEKNQWVKGTDQCLWGGRQADLYGKHDNMVHAFNELKFGAPCVTVLPDGAVYVAFWCYERLVSNIRWIKLHI
ncbi:sialidase family protein [Chitinophaga lutea]